MKDELVFSKFSAIVAERYADDVHQMIWKQSFLLVKPVQLQKTIMNEIMAEIDAICRRALVYEFKQFEMDEVGQLTFQRGSTKWLTSFLSQINSKYVVNFMRRYAYLNDLIQRRIPMIINFGNNVLQDFNYDRFQLGPKFLNCSGRQLRIVEFNYQRNETRCGAKKVLVITTNFGKIVYKPHRLNNDIFFEKMLDLLNKKSEKKINTAGVKSIMVGGHGWQEYIQQAEFKGLPSEYYYEFGILAAWVWLFKIGDLHNGNVLQTSQGIKIIDLENLMTNQITDIISEKIGDCYSNFIKESVLGSLLLPLRVKFYNESTDYSGFIGSREQYIKTNQLVNLGTDNLRFDSIQKRVIKNNLELKGEPVVKHRKAVNQGFTVGVRFIQEHLLEIQKLLDGTYSRQLTASSSFFKELQGNMTHPKFATSITKVNDLLDRQLGPINLDNQLLRNNLLNYDIPYQEHEVSNEDRQSVIWQFKKISSFQIEQQLRLIKCALEILEEPSSQPEITGDVTNIEQRIFEVDSNRSILFTLQFNEDQQVMMSPIDCSVWGGLGEIENVLLSCDRNNNKSIQRILKTVLEMYPVDQLIAEGRLSGYNGIGAYLLVLSHLRSKWAIQTMVLILNKLLQSKTLIQDWSFFEGAGSLVWIVYQLTGDLNFKKQCSKILVMLKKQFNEEKVKSQIEKELITGCLGMASDKGKLLETEKYHFHGTVQEGILLVNLSNVRRTKYVELKQKWIKQAFKSVITNDTLQNGLPGKLLVAERFGYRCEKNERQKKELIARIESKKPRIFGRSWGTGEAGLQYYLLAEQTGNLGLLFCEVGWDD